MKFRTLSTAALVVVVGMVTATPVLVNAAVPSSQVSTGKLEVQSGGLIGLANLIDQNYPQILKLQSNLTQQIMAIRRL